MVVEEDGIFGVGDGDENDDWVATMVEEDGIFLFCIGDTEGNGD